MIAKETQPKFISSAEYYDECSTSNVLHIFARCTHSVDFYTLKFHEKWINVRYIVYL